MALHVNCEKLLSVKASIAETTLVGEVPSVDSLMNRQLLSLAELLMTDVTHMVFDPQVDFHMFLKPNSVSEPFMADTALVRLILEMGFHVIRIT